MAEEMIAAEDVEIHLRLYERAGALVRLDYSPDVGEEVEAFIWNRKAIDSVPSAQDRLVALDSAFSEALAEASPAWIERLDRWAERAGFATAPWWIAVRRQPARAASAR